MIVFTLRCAQGHEFEGWFRDGATFEAQAEAGEIACPHCGDAKVSKAVMAPNVVSSRQSESARAEQASKQAQVIAEMRKALLDLRKEVESKAENVGQKFADEARKIHYGESESRPIYGDASAEEAQDLEEEGIAVARIPWLPKEN